MAEFAGVNLSMDAAVPRKLAQPYLTEVVVLPEELVFPLKNEYERMNSTLEGLTDNRKLQGKEIKDREDVDRPLRGGNDDDDDVMMMMMGIRKENHLQTRTRSMMEKGSEEFL